MSHGYSIPFITSAPDCLCLKYPSIVNSFPACSHVIVGGGIPEAEHGRDTFFRMSTPMDAGALLITGPAVFTKCMRHSIKISIRLHFEQQYSVL